MNVPVSSMWISSVQERFRRQAFLKFAIQVIPPGLRDGLTIASSSTLSITSTDTIKDGLKTTIAPMATLEQDRWIGDGSMYLPSPTVADNLSVEWTDDSVTHTDSGFSTLTFTFDRSYDIPGIYGLWDTQTNSWPTKLVIKGYDSLGTLINTYTITDITSTSKFMEVSFDNCKSVVMEFHGWSNSDWRARCTEIIFGVYLEYDTDSIFGASQHSAESPISDALPSHTANVTLGNYNSEYDPMLAAGYSRYIEAKQIVFWQWEFILSDGTREVADIQTYFISKSASIDQGASTYSIKLGSRLDFLTDSYRLGDFTGTSITLKAMAQAILNNCDLIPQYDGEVPYTLCDTLDAATSNAPIPLIPSNLCLQYIAGAAGCLLGTNPTNGYIRIHDLDALISESLTQAQQLGDPGIEVQDKIYTLKINVYNYSLAAEASKIYKSALKLSGQTAVELAYKGDMIAKNITPTIVNGAINAITYYNRYAVAIITPTNPANDVEIELDGYEVVTSITTVETYRDTTLERGLDIIIDNPFITNTNYLATLTTKLLNFYSKRQVVTARYTGYPEVMAGAQINVVTKYGESAGPILENTVDYNGGWSGILITRVGG